MMGATYCTHTPPYGCNLLHPMGATSSIRSRTNRSRVRLKARFEAEQRVKRFQFCKKRKIEQITNNVILLI